MRRITSVKMLDAVTATGASARMFMNDEKATFMAAGETSAGAGAATIRIEVSNVARPSTATSGDGYADWIIAGTITLTLATTASVDGFAIDAAWRWCRANITAISGTDATVTVTKGA